MVSFEEKLEKKKEKKRKKKALRTFGWFVSYESILQTEWYYMYDIYKKYHSKEHWLSTTLLKWDYAFYFLMKYMDTV